MLCTVFGSTLALFTNQLERECRRLWRPKRWPGLISTPALMAAGRRWSATNTAGETGTRPTSGRHAVIITNNLRQQLIPIFDEFNRRNDGGPSVLQPHERC